jgi:hypothetical protein
MALFPNEGDKSGETALSLKSVNSNGIRGEQRYYRNFAGYK